jgi:alpha-glucosidase (family GH31 glycosyl hydrolase)
MRIAIITALLFLLGVARPCSGQQLQWNKLASGIWLAKVGNPDSVNFLTTAGAEPKITTINAMADVPFPLSEEEISYKLVDGKTYLHFPLDHVEKIFGLGLNFKTVEQRGRIMRLHVDHYGGRDNGRTHAPVPFYVSSKGYGVFINSPTYIDVWVGTAVRKDSKNPPEIRDRNTDKSWDSSPYSDNIEVLIPASGTEVYVFGGPTMLNVVQRFNLFNGGGCLPPRWGLGFWHRTPTLYSDKDVAAEVAEFKKRNFPLSVIGLEPGWQSRSYPCTYEWDSGRFPEPTKFVNNMNQQGVQVNVWLNPFVSPESELYHPILPFTASHTVWTGVVPDYSLPAARNLIASHFQKNLLNMGVSGYKMDENDGYDEWLWPDVTTFPSGHSAEQMRQLYGVMMQKMTTELYRNKNLRTYGLVRASNAGATSFPYVIYNDYYSHPDFITALINSSFIGVLWTPEVRGSATAEEWLRRMQTVCFSPLAMLNAWSDGTKPWSFPEVEKQVFDVAWLRMQLLPYLYTTYAEYTFFGTPPIRAMNLEDGFTGDAQNIPGELSSTENPYAAAIKKEIKDQFMVGDALLIAPLFTGQKERSVILPKGKWYDFYTGKLAGEGEIITASGLDRIPVFVKDGSIIPMAQNPDPHFDPAKKVDLEIRHYGTKTGNYKLYDDDGVTFNYESGAYSWREITVTRKKDGTLTGSISKAEKGKPDTFGKVVWRFKTPPSR